MATAKKTPAVKVSAFSVKPRVKSPTSWSFSRYSDYKTCPRKFKIKHIDRIAEPKSDAMQRGIDAHDQAEKYIKGTLAKLPELFAPMKAELDFMKKAYKAKKFPMIVEDNWAFTKDWEETEWDNWTACWVRIKLDAAHYTDGATMFVTDWKTGKPSQYKVVEYLEQLELYALSAILMSVVEDVNVHVRLAFVETGDMIKPEDAQGREIVYTRKDLPKLKKTWENRVKPMMNDTTFAPRANNTCKWCFYGQAGKAKDGPGLCEY